MAIYFKRRGRYEQKYIADKDAKKIQTQVMKWDIFHNMLPVRKFVSIPS